MKCFLPAISIVFFSACSYIAGSVPTGPEYLTERQAAEIARNYVTENNLFWGEPIARKNTNNSFWFYYDTPEEESRLVSGRALYVSIKTGKVTIPPRL
jgi:hypothetical protein